VDNTIVLTISREAQGVYLEGS